MKKGVQNGVYDKASTQALFQGYLRDIKDRWSLDDGEVIDGDGEFWSRTRYLGPTGVPLEFLNFTYVADYFLQGHCYPGSKNLHIADLPGEAGPFGCPGLKEQRKGQTAGYFIGDEAMKWFLAHPKKADISV